MTNCPIHPDTELICFCPKCRGQIGGKSRKLKHSKEQLRKWGKKGGRPRKKADKSSAALHPGALLGEGDDDRAAIGNIISAAIDKAEGR